MRLPVMGAGMGPAAVVLLSGGLDSATMLAMVAADGCEVFALTVRYGQRHAIEVAAACKVARAQGVAVHRIIDLDLGFVGGSALTGPQEVPKDRTPEQRAAGIPVTYVPARNTIFLSIALAWAEVLGARDLFFGATLDDFDGYPDCRPEFFNEFERMARLATKAGVESHGLVVHTPLIGMRKAEIVRRGLALGVDYGPTLTCYDPTPRACGRCDACQIRLRAFAENGIPDPAYDWQRIG